MSKNVYVVVREIVGQPSSAMVYTTVDNDGKPLTNKKQALKLMTYVKKEFNKIFEITRLPFPYRFRLVNLNAGPSRKLYPHEKSNDINW